MIVSINQPAYLPWLGYFHRIAASDLHIVLDHVQFEKNSFVNRNRIRVPGGWCWLTVPVKTKGRFGDLSIPSLEIDASRPWRAKHWRSIELNYRRAPHFAEHAGFFASFYDRDVRYLAPLCRELTTYLLDALGIRTPMLFSSDLRPRGTKDELVLDLCRRVGADTYLSGVLGRNYLREERFREEGIAVRYQEYRHPQYPQCWGAPFESSMSIIDLLFNCGPRSLEVLLGGQESIREASEVGGGR